MSTTTTYGSWSTLISTYSSSPDDDVANYVGTGDPGWRNLLEESGAYCRMISAYRAAIEEALPPSVSLCGSDFIGPWQPGSGEFDGYPVDKNGALDIAACLEGIDLESIIEKHNPESGSE